MCVLGLRFRLRPATPGWGVGVWVCLCACSACTPPLLAGMCDVGVSAWTRVAATPRHSQAGRWGLCLSVCALRLYPATPGPGVRCGCVCLSSGSGCAPHFWLGCCGCVCVSVRPLLVPRHSWRGRVCVCVGLGFACTPLFSWFGCWGAWPLAFAASVSRHLLVGLFVVWGCAGIAVGGFCPPPSPFVFFFRDARGVWFLALSCPGFVVFAAASPGLGTLGLRPPFPFRSGCAYGFFFASPCYSRVSVGVSGVSFPLVGRCARLGVAGFGRAVLGCAFGGAHGCRLRCCLAGGFACLLWSGCAASRLRLCLLSHPLFFGGVCLFLPLPSLGRCTHWSAFGVANRVPVGACGLPGRAPTPWVGWVMDTLGLVAFPVGLGSGSAGWAVAPGGFVRPWVRGGGVLRVPPPLWCQL